MGETNSSITLKLRRLVVAAAVISTVFAAAGSGASMSGHHSFLGGPWELVFKVGMEGTGYRFAIKVPDETKPHQFGSVLPIMGTDVKIRLDKYLPDLQWDESAVDDPNGGALVKLDMSGPNLDQRIWLDTADPAKQSITAPIGAMAIRKLHNPKTAGKVMKELVASGAVGVLTVRTSEDAAPAEFVVSKGTKVKPGDSGKVLEVVEYYPHYSIESATNKVTNASDAPINPAIKLRVVDGSKVHEEWLWSKFPSAPHGKENAGLEMRFADFDLSKAGRGRYILAVAGDEQMWLVSKDENGKTALQKARLNEPYDFAVDGYTFKIVEVHEKAVLNKSWSNHSEKLLHPALVATVTSDGVTQEVVLSLGKPGHIKTRTGTVVLFFRRSPGDEKPS